MIIEWLIGNGQWLVYGIVFTYIMCLLLNLIIYLYRINFDDSYNPISVYAMLYSVCCC